MISLSDIMSQTTVSTNPSMHGASIYNKFHHQQIQSDSIDIITYDNISPELLSNKNEFISILSVGSDNTMYAPHYWKLSSAYEWFVKQCKSVDLHIQTPIAPFRLDSLRQRINNQQQLQHHFANDYIPDSTTLNTLFYKMCMEPSTVSDAETLLLKVYLHMDDMDIMSVWPPSGVSPRTQAEQCLADKPSGSWLLRKYSGRDSDIIKARVISLKLKGTEQIVHIIVAHIYGYGYISFTPNSGEQMPTFNQQQKIHYHHYVHASFIDILQNISQSYIQLQLFVKI